MTIGHLVGQAKNNSCPSSHTIVPRLMIEVGPAHKYSISDFKIKECKLLNSTTIASGYAGRDPQGGESTPRGGWVNRCTANLMN